MVAHSKLARKKLRKIFRRNYNMNTTHLRNRASIASIHAVKSLCCIKCSSKNWYEYPVNHPKVDIRCETCLTEYQVKCQELKKMFGRKHVRVAAGRTRHYEDAHAAKKMVYILLPYQKTENGARLKSIYYVDSENLSIDQVRGHAGGRCNIIFQYGTVKKYPLQVSSIALS